MGTNDVATTNSTATIIVVDAPEVSLAANENPTELLLHFYRALGWNGNDILDPCKIRTTQEVYNHLYKQMYERCSNPIGVGMFMMNRGPGVDEHISTGTVHLLEGWTKPALEEGGDFHTT